jgi:hypothetical protein
VLFGVEFDLMGGALAELKEGAELVAELREGLKEVGLIFGWSWLWFHLYLYRNTI